MLKKMLISPYRFGVGYLVLLLLMATSVASQDMSGLRLNAEHFSGSLQTGETTLTGDVTVETDNLKLSADEVTVKRNDENEMVKIVASGSPIELTMELDTDEDNQAIEAEAIGLTFDRKENWIEFKGEARLTVDNAEIKADTIKIDLESQEISATMDDPEKQVEITMTEVDEL